MAGGLREDDEVSDLSPAANGDAARWLFGGDVDWWDLVRYGPPGFEVYLRIALGDSADREGEEPAMREALAILAGHTTTPVTGDAAIWEGWTGGRPRAPTAPRVPIRNRAMLLFTGPIADLRDAPARAWYGFAQGTHQEPHLVWPEDRAWCLACEVDEEIEFTVGCSLDASRGLSAALPDAVRSVPYGAPAPLYRS